VLLRSFSALSLVSFTLLTLCLCLGLWQIGRMQEKEELLERFSHPMDVELQEAIARRGLYAHVRARGRYRTGWHLLLDNKILDGRPGVHVLSLFDPDSGLPILVNRGWLPLSPDRRILPDIPTPAGRLDINGILNSPPAGGVRLGDPDTLDGLSGTRLITYLEIGELASALGENLSPWMIQLDEGDSSGFAGRDWKPTVMQPEQHAAYALQWFALAMMIAIYWIRSGLKFLGRLKTDAAGLNDGNGNSS